MVVGDRKFDYMSLIIKSAAVIGAGTMGSGIAAHLANCGIPTLMLFKAGNVEATKVGAMSKSQLSAFIDSNL